MKRFFLLTVSVLAGCNAPIPPAPSLQLPVKPVSSLSLTQSVASPVVATRSSLPSVYRSADETAPIQHASAHAAPAYVSSTYAPPVSASDFYVAPAYPPPMAAFTLIDIEPPRIQPSPVRVALAPPPLLVEVPPSQPWSNAIWIGGYWVWQGDWVWARGRWSDPPQVGYAWIHPYYENRRGDVLFVNGFWAAPGVQFVPPPPQLSIAIAVASVGVVGSRCIGPEGIFIPAPPGSRRGLIVPAPLGTAPAVVATAPAIINTGMRIQANNIVHNVMTGNRIDVTNITNITNNGDRRVENRIENRIDNRTTSINKVTNVNNVTVNRFTIIAPRGTTATGQAVHLSVPAQVHAAAAVAPHPAAPMLAALTPPLHAVRSATPVTPAAPVAASRGAGPGQMSARSTMPVKPATTANTSPPAHAATFLAVSLPARPTGTPIEPSVAPSRQPVQVVFDQKRLAERMRGVPPHFQAPTGARVEQPVHAPPAMLGHPQMWMKVQPPAALPLPSKPLKPASPAPATHAEPVTHQPPPDHHADHKAQPAATHQHAQQSR